MKTLTLKQHILDLEKLIARNKMVLSKFPDAMMSHSYGFISSSVNKNYEKLEFKHSYNSLKMIPYSEVQYMSNNIEKLIRISSNPRSIRVAYIGWNRVTKSREIRFSRLKINLKNNSFDEALFKKCSEEVIKFIKAHPNTPINAKYLEPRLKELIAFI